MCYKRYWLAGCLTTTASASFEFIPVNQFLDIQPNVEEPLHCHNRVAVNNAGYVPLENAYARITAVNALTNEPLEGVLASVSDGSNSQTGLTGSDGAVDIPITQNGEYGLTSWAELGQAQLQLELGFTLIKVCCIILMITNYHYISLSTISLCTQLLAY